MWEKLGFSQEEFARFLKVKKHILCDLERAVGNREAAEILFLLEELS